MFLLIGILAIVFDTVLSSAESQSPSDSLAAEQCEPFNKAALHNYVRLKLPATESVLLQPRTREKASLVFPTPEFAFTRMAAKKQTINMGRLYVVSSGFVIANYYAYWRLKDIWWSNPKTKFHFYRDWRQTQGSYDFGFDDSLWHHIDKLGHYYNTRYASLLLADTAKWIGFQKKQSLWIGAITSWLLFLQIELFDSQFEEWGFSLGDLAANTAGAFTPILSDHYPVLQNFRLKLSYHISEEIDKERYVVEDYAGMTFWLTASPRLILPDVLDRFWPGFLNVAFGYGVSQKAHGEVELYLGLDYNLEKIRTKSALLNRMIYYMDYLHLPAPAIRIRPMKESYFLYY